MLKSNILNKFKWTATSICCKPYGLNVKVARCFGRNIIGAQEILASYWRSAIQETILLYFDRSWPHINLVI